MENGCIFIIFLGESSRLLLFGPLGLRWTVKSWRGKPATRMGSCGYSASCVFPSHKTSQNMSVLRNKTQKPVRKTWKNSCHIIDINLDYRMIRMDQIHMNSRYNPNSWAILGAPLRLSGGNCLWPLPAATRKPGKGLTQLWGSGWKWSIYR